MTDAKPLPPVDQHAGEERNAAAALQGVLQAHVLTMPALVNDMLWRHAVGVSNDALEAAAGLVEREIADAAQPLTLAEVPGLIRSLKQSMQR